MNPNLPAAYRGDTYIISFELQQANGAPQDLTDCVLRFGVADIKCMDQPFLTKVVGSGITINDMEGGAGVIRIEKGELNRVGIMAFELEVILPTGESYTYVQGKFPVKETMFPRT